MSDHQQESSPTNGSRTGEGFTWHPHHAGKSYERVYGDLVEEIGRDQRSYRLAMDGAEGAEHDSLTTVVELERRWSVYDFDWAEMDPKQLAERILTFEKERERRKDLFSFEDYRASGALVSRTAETPVRQERSLPIVPIGIAILVVLLIVLALVVIR